MRLVWPRPWAQIEAEGWDLARKCLHFELDFQSTAKMSTADGSYTSTVEAIVKIDLNVDTFKLEGSAELTNTDFTMKPKKCTAVTTPGGATFKVVSRDPDRCSSGRQPSLRLRQGSPSYLRPRQYELRKSPRSAPRERSTTRPCTCGPWPTKRCMPWRSPAAAQRIPPRRRISAASSAGWGSPTCPTSRVFRACHSCRAEQGNPRVGQARPLRITARRSSPRNGLCAMVSFSPRRNGACRSTKKPLEPKMDPLSFTTGLNSKSTLNLWRADAER